jgi:hypothetical protein
MNERPKTATEVAEEQARWQRQVREGLAFVKALPKVEERAFLGLFAGARFPWTIYDNGRAPFIGKAECEWVEDWRGFYAERLPAAGLFFWEEGESGDALGMVRKADGSYHRWTRINCGPTELGWAVREAWWEDLNAAVLRREREERAQ